MGNPISTPPYLPTDIRQLDGAREEVAYENFLPVEVKALIAKIAGCIKLRLVSKNWNKAVEMTVSDSDLKPLTCFHQKYVLPVRGDKENPYPHLTSLKDLDLSHNQLKERGCRVVWH